MSNLNVICIDFNKFVAQSLESLKIFTFEEYQIQILNYKLGN